MTTAEYTAKVRELSDRIVDAQRPLRILDAIKWDENVRRTFLASRGTQLPAVDRDYYASRSLPFDPDDKRAELLGLSRDVSRALGAMNPLGELMQRMCREYLAVIDLLEGRGTPQFSAISQLLYGAAGDALHAGEPTLADLGMRMAAALANLSKHAELPPDRKIYDGSQAVELLQERLDRVFGAGDERLVSVVLSDGIVADAAAGAQKLKIRKEARFSERDLRALEIHEGWVHLGTTLNGAEQPYCTFLSKGPPTSTVTQEGLAIFMEILSFASYPERVKRITNRIRAIDMAERGADFIDVYRFFGDEGLGPEDAYGAASRVFRGSLPDAGPFTKDISYSKGFVLIYTFLQLAVVRGRMDRIPLLCCGKTTLQDIATLAQLVEEGVVRPPRFVPPPFADPRALAAWMCYSHFFSSLTFDRIEADYARML